MPITEPSNSPDDGTTSALLIRRLATRYLFVLALVASLVALDEAVIQPALLRLNLFAPAINLAGRQRMLSQRLTKAALALQAASDEAVRQSRRSELEATLDQWKAAHALLTDPSSAGSQSAELTASWRELDPHFQAMCAAAEQVLRATASKGTAAAQAPAAVDALLVHEPQYLPIMERIVKLLEESAERQVTRLRREALAISAAVMALLVGLGWFVVRPATRTIRAQVDGLEARVAARTRELSDANCALEREIADHQQAEIEKQRLAGQLAHAARLSSLGHLAMGLAHEVNQPLSAIANYAEACELVLGKEQRPNPQIAGFFDQIKRAALRAGNIVRRIRNFARPATSAAVPTSLRALVRDVAELCLFELEQAHIRLSLDLAPGDDLVLVDGIQIQQVLVNLIENSIHALGATPPEQRTISIATYPLGAAVRVDVSDAGPGFGERDPDTIFAPYFTTKEDGLGIGLSLCRSIVARHGGRIWAESLPERGARLSFTLPIAELVKTRTADDDAGIFTNSATTTPLSLIHDDARRESTDSFCCR